MGEKMQAAGTKADAEQGGGLPDPEGAGESGGGAYPNPHGHGDDHPQGGIMGHGGQSEIGYHGTGQLGNERVAGEKNDNSATRED